MSSTIKVHVPLSHQAMRNRTYNRQMRNLYYEKSNYQFRRIKKLIEATAQNIDLLAEIYIFLELLNVCLSYAKSSVYNSKSEKFVAYSEDRHWGILQEEILLVYFLEEQISSVKYIISHVETNRRIQAFANKDENEVVIRHLIPNIDELNKETKKDLKYFYNNIEKRYKIGNNLFGALQELQNFQ